MFIQFHRFLNQARSFTAVGLFCLTLLSAGFASADDKGVEIRTDNFIISGDITESKAKRIAEELEIFRTSIFKMLKVTSTPEVVPVQIFATSRDSRFYKITNNKSIAGAYTTTISGPVFVFNAKGGFKKGSQARHTALHEYVHHVISTYTNQHYPRWYNEGFADFLASYEDKKKTFKIGNPHGHHASFLEWEKWLPMETVIGAVREYPFKAGDRRNQSMFYAQSWLAVHYLQTHPDYSRKTRDYLKRLNNGEDSIQSFEAAYGASMEEFTKTLKSYYRSNDYPTYKFPLTARDRSFDVKSRVLNEAQLKLAVADIRRFFHTKEQTDEVQNALASLHAEPTTRLGSYISLSEESLSHDQYDVSISAAQSAVRTDSNSVDAKRALGVALVEKYSKSEHYDYSKLIEGRNVLSKVLRANSEDPMANYYFALSHMRETQISEDAVRAAMSSVKRLKAVNFVKQRMDMASILERAGLTKTAHRTAEFISVWSSNKSRRNEAKKMIERIDASN